jgi:hypothetical protein
MRPVGHRPSFLLGQRVERAYGQPGCHNKGDLCYDKCAHV